MKKFGEGLTSNEFAICRQLEARGITTLSQAVKAFQRKDDKQIGIWLLENAQFSSSAKQKQDSDAEQDDY